MDMTAVSARRKVNAFLATRVGNLLLAGEQDALRLNRRFTDARYCKCGRTHPFEHRGGKGYVFRHIPDQSEFPDVLFHEGSLVVMVKNEPVAWAWSQEKNGKAAELALEVLPQYRRRGYGRQLAAAWANHIMRQGLVAFYSHLHDNLPSQALAHSLGVIQYAISAGYS